MKTRYLLATLVVLAISSIARFAGIAQAPEVRLTSYTSQFRKSVLLSVRPHSDDWALVESSSDLATWRPVVNLLTTNSSGPFVDYPPTGSRARFYRVRQPGVSVATASSAWRAARPVLYRYRFQHWTLDGGGTAWSGTVTVSNGVKMVSDVTANGHPAATHYPADFLTPDEVFTFIADVESRGVKLAHVAYDDQWSFPTSVLVVSDTPSPITEYRLSEFVDLSGEDGRPAIEHALPKIEPRAQVGPRR